MKILTEISIPKDTVNDDEVLITDIMYSDGEQVVKGDLLMVYESSKASVEMEATLDGYVTYMCAEGTYIPIGNVVAQITDRPQDNAPAPEVMPEKATDSMPTKPAAVFSKAAERYMSTKEIDPALFAGHDLVNLDDVLEMVGETAESDGRIPTVILGGGGHGLVLGDLVSCEAPFRLQGYLDDGKQRGDVVDGFPVLGTIPDIATLCSESPTAALIAVGLVDPDPSLRIRVFELAQSSGALLPPFVHTSATVDPRAVLGRGVQIHAGAVVGPDAILEDGVVINSGAVVSHHCRIGKHTHIAPGAILAGAVSIGGGCLVGMGVTAYLGITIGNNCVIENGADLFKSVPDGTRIGNR